MPKQRSTCTRCSMKRQKCDRKSPCSRCVQNKEAHLCTTQWKDGYDPAVHRRYPRKSLATTLSPNPDGTSGMQLPQANSQVSSASSTNFNQGLPLSIRSQGSERSADSALGASGQSNLPNTSTNLIDFITYGRSDVTDVSMGTLLQEKDVDARKQAIMTRNLDQNHTRPMLNDVPTNSFSTVATSAAMAHVQSLLPNKRQVFLLVDYHDHCMSYCTGGLYHAPSFRKGLVDAYGDSDQLDLQLHDWRWSALLFSILSGAIVGSPEADSASWGFSDEDKLRLSRAWGKAQMACLQIGDYASKHHIYSIQSILNMHTSEHLVGSTKEWAVYQAAGLVIARGLGLHKLGPHPDDGKCSLTLNAAQKDALLQREIGRRVWQALTNQDWLCSTSQGMYSIQKRHYTTIQPGHFDEETLNYITYDNTPTYTKISNFLNELAYNLAQYLDDMLGASDLTTKYHVVLKYDAIMRALTLDKIPQFLDPRFPLNPAWPPWAAWARRSYRASCAHKIIMVHQSFLSKSFKDSRFTYSRWACLTSSKTIIEAMENREPQEPQWWVEQAFVVTAGLCLGLDMFHRPDRDAETNEHQTLVEKSIAILEEWPTSSVAAHGIRLLRSLLDEHAKKFADASKSDNNADDIPLPQIIAPQDLAAEAAERPFETRAQAQAPASEDEPLTGVDFDMDMLGFENLLDGLPLPDSFDNNAFFESMLTMTGPSFM